MSSDPDDNATEEEQDGKNNVVGVCMSTENFELLMKPFRIENKENTTRICAIVSRVFEDICRLCGEEEPLSVMAMLEVRQILAALSKKSRTSVNAHVVKTVIDAETDGVADRIWWMSEADVEAVLRIHSQTVKALKKSLHPDHDIQSFFPINFFMCRVCDLMGQTRPKDVFRFKCTSQQSIALVEKWNRMAACVTPEPWPLIYKHAKQSAKGK